MPPFPLDSPKTSRPLRAIFPFQHHVHKLKPRMVGKPPILKDHHTGAGIRQQHHLGLEAFDPAAVGHQALAVVVEDPPAPGVPGSFDAVLPIEAVAFAGRFHHRGKDVI